MEMNFCRRCGQTLENITGNAYRCSNSHIIYLNASPVVGIYFISDDNTQVLLAERGIEPNKGKLDSLGGFLDGDEDFVAAAKRELTEELSLQPNDYEPLRYLSVGTGTYYYCGETVLLTGIAFWSRLKTGRDLQASDDVAAVQWYDLHQLDLMHIPGEEVRSGIQALRTLFPDVKESQ